MFTLDLVMMRKFIINHEGDAEFTGKVQGFPGTQGNEFVTFDQLLDVQGEIDENKIEKEKGKWIIEKS